MSNTLLLTIKQNHLSCPQNSRMILGNKCQKTQVFYLQQTGREEIIDLCQSSNYIYKIPHEKYLNRIRISLLSLKLQIWRLLRARSSLTFKQNYRVWIQSETGTWTKQPPEVFCLKCYKIHRDFNFTKKETLAQVFSCEFCKNFKNTFSYRTLPVAASDVT